jgi:hypothetical protein
MKKIIVKRVVSLEDAKDLKKSFVDETHYNQLITESCDGYNEEGELLFKFRKGALPLDILKSGYESFKGSIEVTDGRGAASGSSHKRIRKDGTVSNITVGNKVRSGNVGYMDPSAMVRYCRKTAFAKKYFDKFKEGIPFVEFVSDKYEELCPEPYIRQREACNNTDNYYLIGDSVFSTVTVNENFRTAIHQDAGDFKDGFGNLIVYREGEFKGGYFTLPEYGVALDLHNGDMLFVDVHRFHGNSEITDKSEDWKRVSFVLYLREKIQSCGAPEEELTRVRGQFNGDGMTDSW